MGDLVRRDPPQRLRIDCGREWQQLPPERPAALGQEHVDDAAVAAIADTANEALALHVAERARRGRLHHADALTEFALADAVLLPERAEEKPHADADAVRRDARLERTGEGAVGLAHEIADAAARRQDVVLR